MKKGRHSLRSLMKTAASLPDEAKPPNPHFSRYHFFISAASSFLHQPRRGDFIEKSTLSRAFFLVETNGLEPSTSCV